MCQNGKCMDSQRAKVEGCVKGHDSVNGVLRE